jgi:hypothetical protein
MDRGKRKAVKKQGTIPAHRLEAFVRFLKEHPGFSPLLIGEGVLVCGFQVGGSFLRIDEMERLIATQPQFDAQEAAMLLAPSGSFSARALKKRETMSFHAGIMGLKFFNDAEGEMATR